MKAREVMTTKVVSVGPDLATRKVAKMLIDNRISALPVVDDKGSPIGMVSEGDLVSCDTADLQARRDWWLVLLAEGEMLHPDFLASLRAPDRLVRDVMVSPVVTVGEETDVGEIARLLTAHGIKRVRWYVMDGLSASSAVPILFGLLPRKRSSRPSRVAACAVQDHPRRKGSP
jgi:CBS domain-containing protein